MSDILESIKADLLDRRLLPLVAAVALALVGSIGYVVLGGGSSSSAPARTVATSAPVPSGVSVKAQSPERAVAETTSGVSLQRHGSSRDPFLPVVAPKAKSAAVPAGSSKASSNSGSSGSSNSSGSGSSGAGSGGSSSHGTGGSGESSRGTSPSTAPKPTTIYHVAVLFGTQQPQAGSAQTQQLTPYENLKLLTPLPSAKQPLVVFRGVTVGGKSATFTLVGEAILHGAAVCMPSATQCQSIDLQPGQAEQLEILTSAGQPLTYELKVVSIVAAKASAAAATGVLHGESKAGRELLSHAGLLAMPGLRYATTQVGVLVFAGHAAFSARFVPPRRHRR